MLRAMPDSPPAVATGPLAELVRRTWFLEDELLLLRALVPRGSVCLDVGAANGIYTALLARLVGPRGPSTRSSRSPSRCATCARCARCCGPGR